MRVLGWIFVPYIMILFYCKKLSTVKRYAALAWIAFIFISVILTGGSKSDHELTTTPASPAPSSAQSQPTSQTPIHPQETSPPVQASDKPQKEDAAPNEPDEKGQQNQKNYDVVLHFPEDKYPETAAHIHTAFKYGESAVCTIDREGADENRKESLAGIPTKKGYDRDEFPMAMCAEGGVGADIAYVESSDNRGSGSWVGNHLENYANGTRVLFVIDGGKSGSISSSPKAIVVPTAPKPTAAPTLNSSKSDSQVVYYKNCSAVREAGAAPIRKGEPGYSKKLDRDADGIACE